MTKGTSNEVIITGECSQLSRNSPMALRVRKGNSEYMYPVFKFLSSEHAQSLLKQGNVHLPTIHEFRDPKRYKGQIHDIREGQVKIISHYTYYEGLAKDANGTLPCVIPAYNYVRILNKKITGELEISDANIYCATHFFFSDSLKWAIGEGKDSCVLVTDFQLFLQKVSAELDNLKFCTVDDCQYIGRDIEEVNPGPNSLTNYMLSDENRTIFVKPKDYAPQREIRAAWRRLDGTRAEEVTLDVPAVKELCIEVDFSKVEQELLLSSESPETKIGARIIKKSGGDDGQYIIKTPREVFSPVIHRSSSDKGWQLGFHNPGGGTISGGVFENADTGIDLGDGTTPPIVLNVALEDVEKIEVFHAPDSA